MSLPVLATRLYIPRPPRKLAPRARLLERLDEGLWAGYKLSLVSAPAGFGKTTLVSHWIAGRRRQVAWLSLDEGDNDLARFLTDLVAALQTIAPDVGRSVPGLLQPPQAQAEAILTVLLNDLAAVPDSFILVLDDYHVIDAQPLDDALAFLIEHLPPQMHLVIATREDPHLPLARLRARGQLTELRAADLRFRDGEAAEFLNEVMGLSLSEDDIALLDARTEGWIAGLKLAALALQGTLSTQSRQDASGFIREFAGGHRYILDFLVEEVLQRQPAPMRDFLLQTSILDRLSGPLCEAVTGQENGQARLEALERGNFFIVPLGDRRQWYRYHHLFSEVLSVHLAAEQPEQVAILHRRASEWYEQNGSAPDAICHAFGAGDMARAAALVEAAAPAMRRSRQEATLLGCLQGLPNGEIRRRPVLAGLYAHVLLASGKLEGVEKLLRDAERGLEGTAGMRAQAGDAEVATIVVDQEAFRRLPGEIAIARTGIALAGSDVPGTMEYARQALALAPEDDHLTRGAAAAFLGLACWTNGNLEEAFRNYAEGMARLQAAGNIADAVNGATTLATIRIAQGRLRQAMRTYERGLQLAAEQGGVVRGVADMHVGMSEILREWNDLDAARGRLLRSREMGAHMGFPQNQYRWRVAMARVLEAEGDLEGALALLDEAERLYVPEFKPDVQPVAALRARLWLRQGRLADALDWAREEGLSADDEVGFLCEFEHVTLARLLLARQRREGSDSGVAEVMSLLGRLLHSAETGERTGSVIEIQLLQALAHQMQSDTKGALAALGRALSLAEPEGYVRLFVDEGEPMAQLLEGATKGEISPSYVRLLLNALGKCKERPHASPQLREPLSERELEVLRLLDTELSGPQLAGELMVSLSTIRTHMRNIYGKLGVNSRRAAVRRAMELHLL